MNYLPKLGFCSILFRCDLGRKPRHGPQEAISNARQASYTRDAQTRATPAAAWQQQRQDRQGQERRGKSRRGGPAKNTRSQISPGQQASCQANWKGRQGEARTHELQYKPERLEWPKISQNKSGLSQRWKKQQTRGGAPEKICTGTRPVQNQFIDKYVQDPS